MTRRRARERESPASPYAYRPRYARLLGCVLRIVLETLFARRIGRVLAAYPRDHAVRAEGCEHVPREGFFVLAMNHFADGASGASVAACLDALGRARPDLPAHALMVTGHRAAPARSRGGRWLRAVFGAVTRWFRARWRAHLAVIPLGNNDPAITDLRGWRDRARATLSVVFPEGWASREFRAIRPNAGKFLATFDVPTVPAAVWFHEGEWHVRFGPPVRWSPRRALRDVQLGLAIASMLPEALAPSWSHDLARWRAAHSPTTSVPDLSPDAATRATPQAPTAGPDPSTRFAA